jgi:phage head maturation protease
MRILQRLKIIKKILLDLKIKDTSSDKVQKTLNGYIEYFETKSVKFVDSSDHFYESAQMGAIALTDAIHADITQYLATRKG